MVRAAGAKVTKSGSAVDGWTTARSRRWFGYGLALALVVALNLACSDGASELDRALDSVSQQDLAIMVLTLDEFGPYAQQLEVDSYSGFKDAADVADDTIDRDDTAASVEEAGFVKAYSLGFDDPTYSPLRSGSGVLSVSSTLELFSSDAAASAHLAKLLDDQRDLSGEVIEDTVYELLEEFKVHDAGENATGLVIKGTYGEAQFYATGVIFTLGPLRAGVGIIRADDSDQTSEAVRLASVLAKRIEGVLLGDIDEIPVPLPVREDEPQAVGAPSEPPFPEEMVLTLEDFPDLTRIDEEGYVEDEDNQSEYVRDFDVSAVDIGSTRAHSVINNVSLYADESEASALMATVRSVYESSLGTQIMQKAFSEKSGLEITILSLEVVDSNAVGTTAYAINYSYDSPFGVVKGMIYSFQLGRAIGRLTVETFSGEIALDDIEDLARICAARMKSVLEANP